jgi:hypothetical protein
LQLLDFQAMQGSFCFQNQWIFKTCIALYCPKLPSCVQHPVQHLNKKTTINHGSLEILLFAVD